jgi:alkylation response protein AidB-like acyl-CoA dehydrogenase
VNAALDNPVGRARRAAPVIAANAERIEQENALPEAVLDALHGQALFRTLLPRSAGGDEIEPARYVEMLMVLATADASTAWCVCQGSGCSMAAAYMDPGAVAEIWGDQRAVLAWGSPRGPAVAKKVRGGYLASGSWAFGSGNRHATWLGAHCKIDDIDLTLLLPRRQAVIHTGWNVMGLRGTGSDSYEVTESFIPDEFTLRRDRPQFRREPGGLYKFTSSNLYASGFGAVALGTARGALEALKDLAMVKTPLATTRMLRDSPVVQTHVALAEAKLQAARLLLVDTLREAFVSVSGGEELALDMRIRIRMAASFATYTARDVVSSVFHEAGADAVFCGNPFERRFRDVHSAAQQVQGRFSHFETVGAHMLGLEPPLRHL